MGVRGGVKVDNRDQLSPAKAETGAELGNMNCRRLTNFVMGKVYQDEIKV